MLKNLILYQGCWICLFGWSLLSASTQSLDMLGQDSRLIWRNITRYVTPKSVMFSQEWQSISVNEWQPSPSECYWSRDDSSPSRYWLALQYLSQRYQVGIYFPCSDNLVLILWSQCSLWTEDNKKPASPHLNGIDRSIVLERLKP